MNKKAYIRTLEAVIAIVISLVFIAFIIPSRIGGSEINGKESYLGILSQEEGFRNAALSITEGCYGERTNQTVTRIVDRFIPESKEFVVCISQKPDLIPDGLPTKRVNADSYFMSGSASSFNPRIVRIFYWEK